MKSVFIAYNQAYNMEIVEILDKLGCRGYTMWKEMMGRGSETGEPHEGSHAWPTFNNSMLTVIPDEKVDPLLEALHEKDMEYKELGLRAFVWNVEKTY